MPASDDHRLSLQPSSLSRCQSASDSNSAVPKHPRVSLSMIFGTKMRNTTTPLPRCRCILREAGPNLWCRRTSCFSDSPGKGASKEKQNTLPPFHVLRDTRYTSPPDITDESKVQPDRPQPNTLFLAGVRQAPSYTSANLRSATESLRGRLTFSLFRPRRRLNVAYAFVPDLGRERQESLSATRLLALGPLTLSLHTPQRLDRLGQGVHHHTGGSRVGTHGREGGELELLPHEDRRDDEVAVLESTTHGVGHEVNEAQAPEGHFVCRFGVAVFSTMAYSTSLVGNRLVCSYVRGG